MELLPAPYIPVIAIFLILLFSKAKFIASVYIFSLVPNSSGPKILKNFFLLFLYYILFYIVYYKTLICFLINCYIPFLTLHYLPINNKIVEPLYE